MKLAILCFVLLSVATSDITCSSGQTYVKFVKNNGASNAAQESFEIFSGTTKLYTSPAFANNEVRTIEQCLTSSTNNQYTVQMIDSASNSWTSKSYLTIYGKHGNVVFKNLLTASNTETHPFSLYYGIEVNAEWRITSGSATGQWTSYSYSDNDWSPATLGSNSTTSVSGTQYFRKQFTGLASMAAYDVRLYYKAGVIAYINGNEVYRDNLGDGVVTSETPATGQHPTMAYRGFIRPGSEVSSTQSILAVEIHFVSTQAYVDFNAYLAILAPSALDTQCFIYGEPVTFSANPTTGTPSNIFDFSRPTSFYASSTNLPNSVTYNFGGPRPYINGVRVWPYTNPAATPNTFSFEGSNDGNEWTPVVNVDGAIYTTSTYQAFYGYFHSSLYNNYRARIVSSSYTYVYTYEMQPLICSTVLPTSITYTPNTFTFYVYYEQVSIKPDINEFTSCTAQNLPAGLSIDPTTCEITGYGTATASGVSVTVTSIVLGNTYTGTFTITFTECTGTVINILRTYKSSAISESFDIKDSTTQSVVMSVAYNSGQVNNQDWTSIACVTGTKYTVTTDSSLNYWQPLSHLYVRGVLSGDQMETILRIRYDTNIGFSNSRTFNAAYAVKAHSQWYYKHAEVPENWYSSTSTEGWTQGTDSTFPSSSNQIQLYKTTFSVSDVNNLAGVVLSIKYKYGIVVYLNGNEAFRNGVTGTVSTSSYGSNIYSDVMYRQISLPLKTVQIGEVASVNYIQQGSNTISIALVAANAQQTEANFDCAIRLMGEASESRIFDYSVSYSLISGSPTYILNQYYGYTVYYSSCSSNYFNIAFTNDRREWINALTVKLYYTQYNQQPRQFTLKARNSGEDWTTLSTVTELTWSQVGQAQTIYFQNNKAYNEYRFENFATGDSSACYWRLSTLDLESVMTTMTIPDLSYGTSITIFKDIEMGEEYPNSEYYYGFTVTPNLPDGINLDPNTGMISGTATAESTARQYSITANKLTGGTSTATFSFSVEVCTGGRSLVSLVARTDSYPQQASYKLYQGIGTGGTIVDQIDRFMTSSGLNYGDFCMNDGIYTLQLLDANSNGWTNPAGYYLTVDLGEMIFEMGQVPTGVPSVSTMFSTYFPFQINYSDWKVNKEYEENWNSLSLDDSTWTSVKANAIGTNTEITTYIRHDVNIPDIDNYHVLNIRIKYTGGVAAYFNGRLIARFNMQDNFNSETRSISVHSADSFSKFHAIMSTVGGVNGKNVIAFEIHLPSGQSTSSAVVFDATGVFGVNDCSIVVDSFSELDGSTVSVTDLEGLFDLNPVTYGYQSNSLTTYLEWSVENLEGTKFNSFAMQTVYARTSYGFKLLVRSNSEEEYNEALDVNNQSTLALQRTAWSVPVGIAGFTQMRFEVTDTASLTVYVSSYILQYCKPSGSGLCPGEGDYPSVGEGEISPSSCEYGYYGYSYRTCQNGALGPIQTDKCIQKEPANLVYDSSMYNLIMDTDVHIAAPTYMNIIEEFYLGENVFLPMGLTLNTQTGEISGIPTQEVALAAYTIYGKNSRSLTFVVINISVQKGTCKAEGMFPTTNVGEVAVYDCALGGSYVGTQKRACILGATDGEWQNITGMCMSVSLIVILVIVVIVVVVIVIFFIVRVNGKAKAVGGVKGKSAKASSKKSLSKTSSTKAVKV